MKKQGFTLIELMVVIVIMGILAAVAVPKLFGMIAKSKASEVGPAAGTYVKLQDAYASESGTVGLWPAIGYIAPGAKSSSDDTGTTAAFTYSGASTVTVSCPRGSAKNEANKCMTTGDNPTEVSATGGSVTEGFKATSTAKLNDCVLGTAWTLDATTQTGVVTYTNKIGGTEFATAAEACKGLTPQFGTIGK